MDTKREAQIEALRAIVLDRGRFLSDDETERIRKLAEKPAADWSDGDIEAVLKWFEEAGQRTLERKLEYLWDVLSTVLSNLPHTDPLWIQAVAFSEKVFAQESEDALEELEQLVGEAKKRLA